MGFTLMTSHGMTVVHSWGFDFNLICQSSGKIVGVGMGVSGWDIVLDRHGRFGLTLNSWDMDFSWRGRIDGGRATGTAELVMPGLVTQSTPEICTSGSNDWTARSIATPGRYPTPRMRIQLVKHPDGTMSRTISGIVG